MKNLKIMNSKEVKALLNSIEQQFGVKFKEEYAFLSGKDNKVFIVNRDINKIDFDKLRVNSLGMYFCEYKNDEVRLSIEASQLLGEKAKKNVLDLSEEDIAKWVRGKDIDVDLNENVFVIVSNKGDHFGCGRVKDGKLLNFYHKSRRVKSVD